MLIIIAGEEQRFCRQLQKLLVADEHKVAVVPWSAGLPAAVESQPPHLLVLAPPPGTAAVAAVVKAVRARPKLRNLPILAVSPKSGVAEGIALLDAGADDFINRPFNPAIFTARARTLLRRVWAGELPEEPSVTVIQAGPLLMRLVSRQVLVSSRPLALTRLEFDLLSFLMRHAERVFKRDELLEAVWNYPDSVETRTLDKHVETLRKKLGDIGACIQTAHGVGYSFAPPKPSSKSR